MGAYAGHQYRSTISGELPCAGIPFCSDTQTSCRVRLCLTWCSATHLSLLQPSVLTHQGPSDSELPLYSEVSAQCLVHDRECPKWLKVNLLEEFHYLQPRIMCRAAMDAKADVHRQMSDDYGKNISALILSMLVSCIWAQL